MMNRPYVICHMTASVDGKVTGDFLSPPPNAKKQLPMSKPLTAQYR